METPKCIFNNDVNYMKNLVGKTVDVTTIENLNHTGQVYVIDPDSKTLVLTFKKGEHTHILIIPHNSIKSFEISPVAVCEDLLLKKPKKIYDFEELNLKKKRIKTWLERNLISVGEVDMSLKIGENIIMEPPYNVENIICNNTFVLHHLLSLIDKMPDELNVKYSDVQL